MRKVVLTYHAIDGPHCPAVAGSFPVSLDRFIHQINGLRSRGWRIGQPSRLLEPAQADTVYITGDDGTVDWARNVLPWCESEGLFTHTAVITGVWRAEPIYPIAHKVQVLLTARPSSQLPKPTLTAEQRAYIDRIYAYEADPNRRYLKGACNVLFDYAQAEQFLGTLDFDCLTLLAQRFAAPEEYNRFQYAEVGVHTVTHRAYDGDDAGYFQAEVYPCVNALLRNCRRVARLFTLPVKPREGVSLEALCDVLRRHGFVGMLHNPGEWNQRDFVVSRVDAKDVEKFFGLEDFKQ